MDNNQEILQRERRETIYELADLFVVVQEMGQRLAEETHGDGFDEVREFNVLLHQARQRLNHIKREAT
ncbi:hypothetical protein GCM10011369_09130 [Neiella marina]|uniref:Uncharacterized protein n=1 Tax=Neiella marina TaxID=508461 RepID=A0A8J2U366_9GAMM|nr:hypothetical protein [Neiella marina]GGA69657.1 hypothetical protein GCM10011369_09130 [Neiella marina]